MNFDYANLAYCKINLQYDKDVFIKEYDEFILPDSVHINNGKRSLDYTLETNKRWNMVDPAIYETIDYFEQPGDATTLKVYERERRSWKMCQLMELVVHEQTPALLKRYAKFGGSSMRNETLGMEYKLKEKYQNLHIVNWIKNNIPVFDILHLHCVSIEPGGFASIHRDMKGLYDNNSSAGVNKVYTSGYVVICINISSGGVPLYWSFDGINAPHFIVDDDIYLTNDYFLHGVPVCTSRRRQIRITAKPRPELYNIFNLDTLVRIPENYKFDPRFPDLIELENNKII